VETSLPDTSAVFSRVWWAALARLVAALPPDRRDLIDPGIREVADRLGGLSAIEFMDAEAMRAAAGHAMARLHQRVDLALCPTVPAGPPPADAPTVDPVQALWREWAPWTFTFNLTRQPAIAMPLGFTSAGLPRSVQLAAAQYRDDLVLRAARVLELAEPVPLADLG
jgi:aspartyl-tRNA(Asn)/glutamyl-tRNA(Gln) amidotransferase subunit A